MRFRKLPLRCECGRSPKEIREVGLTAEHELVIRWFCSGCKRHIFVVKTLSDCWRECPTRPAGKITGEAIETDISDLQFLRSMGVRFPEGVDG
jgi:hypothetical protein